jgi:ligand-binding sensor domain-containing protein
MIRNKKANLPLQYILLVSLLFIYSDLFSQNYTIKSFTTADGLPHNNVRAIARDSSGFIWLGTWDGLSRFDGHEFKNYFHEPDDSTSIPYFSIRDLFVDRCNNLWIIADTRELVRYNRNTDDFSTLRSIDGIPLENINNISADETGNLWILDQNNIIVLDPSTQECKAFRLIGSDNKPYIIGPGRNWITVVNNSEIWLIGNTINEFRKSNNGDFILIKEYPLIKTYPERPIHFDVTEWYSFFRSPSGNKWLFSNVGLFRLDEESGEFREYGGEIPQKEFTGKRFFFWGKRNYGFYTYDTKKQTLSHIPDYQSKWIMAFLQDEENSYWYSSSSSKGVAMGVSMVAFIPGYFRNTLITSSDSTNPAVYSVIMDINKKVWTGIRGFDHIELFDADKSTGTTDQMNKETLIQAGYIRSMIPVKDGIWIGSYMNLLQFYDYATGKFIRHTPEVWGFRAIAVNRNGNLIIGTGKLSLYYPSSGMTEVLWQSPGNDVIFKVYPDTSGIIWAGMPESRLLKYDTSTGEASVIKVAPGTSNIEDIIAGADGDLWLALLGKGVCRYNTITGTFRYYTTSKGLSNNTTYSLLKDKSGHIWVSTNNGVSMIHPESDHIRTFDESDGIAISEFNSGAKFMADDGEFIFGGMGGFVRFYPDSIKLPTELTYDRRILLTRFEVSGEAKILPGALNKTDTIILDKGENNFHLSFSSTDYINTKKIIFRYMLSGINRKWIETGSQNRNINYSHLRPGWYELILEAADQNGDWTASKKITIRIKPSFYQTRIFIILIPLLLIAIIVFSIMLYIWQLKQKERSKQDELKLQSLRSQMNPHFIFNSLNSINYFISNNDKLSANRYIADFSRLIRSILSNMGSSFIPLEDEINSLRDYLRIEYLRFGDKFDYNLDINEIVNIYELDVCPGMVQPFVENAIWHGVRPLENRKGMINIRFITAKNEGLKCIIEDDGIGRSASMRSRVTNGSHKPKGISIITERLQITGKLRRTNYKLEISDLFNDRKDTGTRVEVDIPAITPITRTV